MTKPMKTKATERAVKRANGNQELKTLHETRIAKGTVVTL